MDFKTLKEQVNTVKGTAFIGIDTLIEVKLTGGKKNPFQGRVTKATTGANVTIYNGTDQSGYENMIKKRMADEGKDPSTFVLGPRAWGTRIPGTPFIEHGEKQYLECLFNSPGKSTYYVDGKETAKEDIEGLPETRDDPDSQGGITNKVVIRTFALESITAVRIKGLELV